MLLRLTISRMVILSLVLLAPALYADDWPSFLGPQGNGISRETGLLNEWPADGPPVLWKKKVGEGYAAPAVLGQRLIFFHRKDTFSFIMGDSFRVKTNAIRFFKFEDGISINLFSTAIPFLMRVSISAIGSVIDIK